MRQTINILLLILFLGCGVTSAQTNTPPRISREEYLHRYQEIAIAHQQRYGIPASITMAQGILESDCGNSRLSRSSNNHFGIKCKGGWSGRSVRHDDDAPNECFRAYDSVEESYRDHAEFLEGSPRYDSLFRFDPTDYRSWARGLKGAGYATAPNYTEMLIKIIEDSKLYELDRMASDPRYRTSIIYTPRPVLDRGVGGGGVDPNNFRIAANSSGGYSLYTINSSTYIIAKDGDSYTSVGRSLGLSRKTLLRFNDESDETSSRVLGAGEVIYIERKGKRWVGNLREHMVLEGETLRSISQTYGIRHQSLRRYNHIRQGEEPTIGAKIRLQ